MPRVSVIIPCYNQGQFIDEAVDSILAQSFSDLEIIIINDGSTDAATNRLLEHYQREKTKVIATSNQGLAAARNNGISHATGEYIIPLDADDRIESPYIEEAVQVLDGDIKTGIVYCRARLFGAVDADWLLPDFSIEEMLSDNVIFCTAMFRRADWVAVGGYDPGMVYGWEDYEFWLSLIERGRIVHRLEGNYFRYRVSADSMVRSLEKQRKIEMFKRIYQRHADFIGNHIEIWLEPLLDRRERYRTGRLYVDCGNGASDQDSIIRKVSLGQQVLTLPVTSFAGRKAYRFDPADCPVVLVLKRVEAIIGTTPQAIDLASMHTNAAYRSGNRLYFETDDPQIFFPSLRCPDHELSGFVIEINIISFGDEALRAIIELQRCQALVDPKTSLLTRIVRFCTRQGY